MGYSRALVNVRHPPSHNAAAATALLLLAILLTRNLRPGLKQGLHSSLNTRGVT
jgi:hypothetical protein